MGACSSTVNCKGKKYQKQQRPTIVKRPSINDFSLDDEDQTSSPLKNNTTIAVNDPLIRGGTNFITHEQARIGVHFQLDELAVAIFRKLFQEKNGQKIQLNMMNLRGQVIKNGRLEKWYKMVTYKLDADFVDKVIITKNKTLTDSIEFSKYAKIGLTNFYETYPDLFLSRLSKGPPPQYRWLAWKVAISKNLQKTKGLYEELLSKIPENECMIDIKKDLNRTFPGHPFFELEEKGNIGLQCMQNVLQAYSIFNKKVGYCQGMNFVVGFILLINGGSERDAFWFFAQLTRPNQQQSGSRIFDQYDCIYRKNLPLMLQYLYQFDVLFENYLPDLYRHFQNEGVPPMLCFGKWFNSLFIISFPMSLCIRIWDNLLVYGSIYIFQVSLAILKLLEEPLMERDLDGINKYLKSFKKDELAAYQGTQFEEPLNTELPADELIIQESLKIKIDQEQLEKVQEDYKKSLPQKEKKKIKMEKLQMQEIERQKQTRMMKRRVIKNVDSQNGNINQEAVSVYNSSQVLQQIKEEKIVMEDFKYSEEDVDRQEDQQARSSENQQIGGSSGGMNAELSSGGQLQKHSQFNPTIVSYVEQNQHQSSMKMRVTNNNSTRMLMGNNIGNRSEKMQVQPIVNGNGSSGHDDKASASLSINRYNMVFAQTIQNNKEEKSLTYKNSSENFSIQNSIADPGEVGSQGGHIGGLNRVPSNSSYLNKISHTNIVVNQAIDQSQKKKNEINLGRSVKVKSGIPPLGSGSQLNTVGSSTIQNIYQFQHQMRLKKTEIADEMLREVELEEISEGKDDEQMNHDEDESREMSCVGDEEEYDDPDLSRQDPDEDVVQQFNNRELIEQHNGFEIPAHSHSHNNSVRKLRNNLVGKRFQANTQFDNPIKIKRELYLSTLDNPIPESVIPQSNTSLGLPPLKHDNQQSYTIIRRDDAAGSERATPQIIEEQTLQQQDSGLMMNEDDSKRRTIGKKKKKKVAKRVLEHEGIESEYIKQTE